MTGFTKLFSSIVHSTIWREPNHVRLVWVTMLALVDKDGVVEAAVPGLADAARVSLEECEDALDRFMKPDKYSRNQVDEGRRIRAIQGGWALVNHAHYLRLMSAEEKKEKDALRKQKERAAAKLARGMSDGCPSPSENVPEVAHTDQTQIRSDQIQSAPLRERSRAHEGRPGVARSYSLPCEEPPEDYLAQADVECTPREQAKATWAHYWGAGLPDRGVERLYAWLLKRAREHLAGQARVGKGAPAGGYVPAKGKFGQAPRQGDHGLTGFEKADIK